MLLQQQWPWCQGQVEEEREGEIRSEGKCKKRSSTSNYTQVLMRGVSMLDVSSKERQMVVFSVTQSFTLTTTTNYLEFVVRMN